MLLQSIKIETRKQQELRLTSDQLGSFVKWHIDPLHNLVMFDFKWSMVLQQVCPIISLELHRKIIIRWN